MRTYRYDADHDEITDSVLALGNKIKAVSIYEGTITEVHLHHIIYTAENGKTGVINADSLLNNRGYIYDAPRWEMEVTVMDDKYKVGDVISTQQDLDDLPFRTILHSKSGVYQKFLTGWYTPGDNQPCLRSSLANERPKILSLPEEE